MSVKYAKDQPAGFSNRIEKVAVVGASGNVGKHFVQELLKTGKHTVTALTRAGSKSEFPAGVKRVEIDYDDEESLVAALKDQQFFVITLSVRAGPDEHSKLVNAAAKAGIAYVMPNAYGNDLFNESLANEDMVGAKYRQVCEEVENTGVSSYIAMLCGFWYEWSLALGEPWFGFDLKNKKVVFFDDGTTKINTSTWQQCGRALAGLLSLKELPEDKNDKSATVSSWKNKPLYITSFLASQRDMLDSLHRVLGDTDSDWEITHQPSKERWQKGVEDMKKGDRLGFGRAMYTRTFFPNGGGDFENHRTLANDALGIKREDIDVGTKKTLELVESGFNPFGG
ncbi:hypothetical protein MMC25_004343 [Agyrium rufum]|nr:hypothetical protein [Agyrium rufum]